MTFAATPDNSGRPDAPQLRLDARAGLGECPRWSVREQVLYWVDIAACSFNRFDPVSGENTIRVFDEPVACFAERRNGGFVLAMRNRFALIDQFDTPLRWLGEPVPVASEGRFNDGRCDAHGRFLAGTIDFDGTGGALYRVDAGGVVTRLVDGVRSANGLAFSPDGQTMYWSDTRNHIVRCWDYHGASGAISHSRTFAEFEPGNGRPDGASVDADGCYWSALYDGARVVRFAPDGRFVQEVAIPSRHVTMVAFGDHDLRTAYVTTARQQLDPERLAQHPCSGGIFSYPVQVPGLSEPLFAG
ncbi:MAG: SMP-30/gluconolactonase/LRE family protein [Rhodanobacter sp.]